MSDPATIIYAGSGLSGRTESLKAIGAVAVPAFDPVRQPQPWSVRTVSGRPRSVKIGCLRSRGWLHQSFSEAWGDQRVRPELELLRQARGLVFVVDSQAVALPWAQEALALLRADLQSLDRQPEQLALVFQANKRDLPGARAMTELESALSWPSAAWCQSVAVTGEGALEAFEMLVNLCGL